MTITQDTVTLTVTQQIAGEVRAILARRGQSARAFAEAHDLPVMWLSRRIGTKATVAITVDELVLLADLLQVAPSTLLPRLDSNQQPSGLLSGLVSDGDEWGLAA